MNVTSKWALSRPAIIEANESCRIKSRSIRGITVTQVFDVLHQSPYLLPSNIRDVTLVGVGKLHAQFAFEGLLISTMRNTGTM